LGVVLGGFLVAEPGAAEQFHAAFFVDSEALGGDEVALARSSPSCLDA